jgi:hypothetical protein
MILDDKTVPRNQRIEPSKYPQTQQVFNVPKLDFDSHTWVQRGYKIYDECEGCVNQAVPIPIGKMLIRKGDRYDIVDERR